MEYSEQLLSSIIESSIDGFWLVDRIGNLLEVNDTACLMSGYCREELLKMNVAALEAAESPEQVQRHVQNVIESGEGRFKTRHRRKDGSVREVEISTRYVNIEGGRLVAFVRDISEQRNAEERLRQSEVKFRNLVETAQDLIFQCDGEGRYTYLNKSWESVLGYSLEEMLGKRFTDFQTPEVAQRDMTEFARLQQGGMVKGYKTIHLGKDGHEINLSFNSKSNYDDHGNIIGTNGTAQDITEREEALAARLREQAFTETALNAQEDTFFLFDPKTGTAIRWNRAFSRLSGYSDEEIASLPVPQSYYSPEDLSRATSFIENIYQHRQGTIEMELICKNGEKIPTEYRVSLVNDSDGEPRYLISIGRDISERIKAKKALQEREQLYRALVEGIPDVVMRFNREGRHLYVSSNVEQLMKRPAGELIGKTFRELGFDDDMCQFWEEGIEQVFSSGLPYESEYTLVFDSNETILNWRLTPECDQSGEVRSVVSIARDVTRLHKIERDYETLFEEMLNGFAVHEIICDEAGKPVDYRFIALNPAFQNMTGMSPDIIGTTIKEIMPDIEQSWIDIYGKVALTGEPYFFENYNAALGKYFEVTTFRPAPMQFACIFADITARRELEEKWRQAEKMEAIGHLAGGIAHDFNNILGGIIGYTDMSLDEVYEGSLLHNNLTQIMHASDRAKHLVSQILSFSRQSSQSKDAIFVTPIVGEVVQLLRATLPSSIEIKTDLRQGLQPVMADATKIHEIVMNLCTNATHSMNDEKGVLHVSCGDHTVVTAIEGCHGKIEPGAYTRITVADTGSGMDDVTLSHIFEPFYTTKGVGKGTGMGLAVVFGIVKSHNGNITVTSEVGKGTTFHVYLPKTTHKHDMQTPGESTIKGGMDRILFVDDEQFLCEMAESLLGQLGYKVVACADSRQALSQFIETPNAFDLLITDQTMPGLTGLELSKAVHAIRTDLPVILCTGYSKLVDEQSAGAQGIRGFLMKPLRKKELATLIRDVLDGKR